MNKTVDYGLTSKNSIQLHNCLATAGIGFVYAVETLLRCVKLRFRGKFHLN